MATPVPVAALQLLCDTRISQGARLPLRPRLPIRVVSFNRLTREGIAELLAQQTGFDVASCEPESLIGSPSAPSGAREIIVLDQATDGDQVVKLAIRIRSVMPRAHVIVTGVVSHDSIQELADAGVRAFVMRGASPDEVAAMIGTNAVEGTVPL